MGKTSLKMDVLGIKSDLDFNTVFFSLYTNTLPEHSIVFESEFRWFALLLHVPSESELLSIISSTPKNSKYSGLD